METGEGQRTLSRQPCDVTARSRSPLMSACELSLEGEEAEFCWAVEVADASGVEVEVEVLASPASPGFPSNSRNLPRCL